MKLYCTVCILAVCCLAGAAEQGCEGNSQPIISLDSSLLPISNIVASRDTFSWPDENFINFGADRQDVWCAFSGPLPYLNLTFLEPVVVTGLISGGYRYASGNVDYVNNFTVQYSAAQGIAGSLSFFAPAINTYFVVDEPFVAERITLLVEGFVTVSGDICWSLGVIGCRMPEPQPQASVILSSSPTTSSTLSSSPTVPAMLACSNAATPPAQSAESAEKDFMVLAIALPIAIMTVVVVAVIVAIGVFICVHTRHKWGPSDTIRYSCENSDSHTVKVIPDSTVYSEPREDNPDGRGRSETIREVANILYTDPSSESKTHGSSSGQGMPDADDMQLNQNYSVPFQDQSIEMKINASYTSTVSPPDHHGYEKLTHH